MRHHVPFDQAYFAAWNHETLAKLAAELTAENESLKRDLKAALEAFRKECQK